jgi:hypothetical protein
MYTASPFQIRRLFYELDYLGMKSSHQNWPLAFMVQGSDNWGASFYRLPSWAK